MGNYSKTFGLTFINDDHYYAKVAVFLNILNGFCRIAWGFNYDRWDFFTSSHFVSWSDLDFTVFPSQIWFQSVLHLDRTDCDNNHLDPSLTSDDRYTDFMITIISNNLHQGKIILVLSCVMACGCQFSTPHSRVFTPLWRQGLMMPLVLCITSQILGCSSHSYWLIVLS